MLTHRNLTVNNLQFTTALRTNFTDVALLFLPFYHIYGVMLTGSFLACSSTQIMMERFDFLQSLELCEKRRIGVPADGTSGGNGLRGCRYS